MKGRDSLSQFNQSAALGVIPVSLVAVQECSRACSWLCRFSIVQALVPEILADGDMEEKLDSFVLCCYS